MAASDGSAGRPTWVLDPIDGTVNFVYGLPAYVVSVAVQVDGRSVAGAVADVVDGAVYSAARGHGRARASRDGTRRRCGAARSTTCRCRWWAPDSATTRSCVQRQAAVLATLLPQIRDVRRFGSAALDLCMVAAGQLDAYYEDNLNVWDWAAGRADRRRGRAHVRLPSPSGSVGGAGLVVAAAPGVDRRSHATR